MDKSENSRTGKPLANRLVQQFEAAEAKREEDLERVRLRNISMRTQLKKLERSLRAREQLAEGLHIIDFEQLKVENQTLNEKIEERSEELTKLKRKKTTTVQVLTHVREKLRFIENENSKVSERLAEVENDTMGKRGNLTGIKKQRDLVRGDNVELKRRQGFASSNGLLQDFEKRSGSLQDIKAELEELQSRYRMLCEQCVMDEATIQQHTQRTSVSFNPFPLPPSAPTQQSRGGGTGLGGQTSKGGMGGGGRGGGRGMGVGSRGGGGSGKG